MSVERSSESLRTHESFSFTANGPMNVVAPLFGADRERLWAPGWEPRFVWPAGARDEEGMVFTVAHEDGTAVWVNTRFDLENGEVQYVYVLPDVMATCITLRISPAGERTHVEVDYERTALDEGAAPLVIEMARQDAEAGSEWKEQIDRYLAGPAERSR